MAHNTFGVSVFATIPMPALPYPRYFDNNSGLMASCRGPVLKFFTTPTISPLPEPNQTKIFSQRVFIGSVFKPFTVSSFTTTLFIRSSSG
jgi:hypothetical protein